MAYCPKCNAKIAEMATRCPSCDYDFSAEAVHREPPQTVGEWIGKRWFVLMALAFLFCVLWGMTLPTGHLPRPRACRLNCKGNMRQVALGLWMYMSDNDGELPPTLYRLVETGYCDAVRCYVCYGDGKRSRKWRRRTQGLPRPPHNSSEFYTDYWYVRPSRRPSELPPETVVLMDKKENHKGCGNALLAGDLVGSPAGETEIREFVGQIWEELVDKHQRTED